MKIIIAILQRLRPADYALDLLAFAGTVALALAFRWQAHDLIWSLWISSLSFGYFWLLAALTCSVIYTPGRKKIGAIIGGLFLAAFFTFHFGMFHFVHGVFLNLFFPLVKENFGPPNVFTLIGTALSAYWPFVLMTFVSRVRDFPWRQQPDDEGKAMFAPYLNVIRMHLLIFIFGGLYLLHLANLAIFPVLLFYFFPWRIFNRERKALAKTPRSPKNI
ncbi:MAG: DUF6498-containing protein [Kiritimatiellaeota bacterium]|nr:DUF6498-containing protein [Kiritimatiellota bacterium]